jgi:hypothetical protein
MSVDVSRSRLPYPLSNLRIRKRSSDERVGQGRLPNGTEAENGDLAVDECRILPLVHIVCCGLRQRRTLFYVRLSKLEFHTSSDQYGTVFSKNFKSFSSSMHQLLISKLEWRTNLWLPVPCCKMPEVSRS